ncbi:hypothetical protein M569_12611 [Genlisea aurea]|uniref:Uncharacterized protein n=1 Tax=Genlisea aurea TaxID=192259 RepID=S8DQV8_9LAMI|nr:hypothetical protein M569_12611 [Genlisea aurea]
MPAAAYGSVIYISPSELPVFDLRMCSECWNEENSGLGLHEPMSLKRKFIRSNARS